VGLQDLGARDPPALPSAAGKNHLRRALDTLAGVRSADGAVKDEKRLVGQLRRRTPAGALVVVLTPAISAQVPAHAILLGRSGISVVVVDTLPHELPDPRHLRELTPGRMGTPRGPARGITSR
jgi:hypothetical protein